MYTESMLYHLISTQHFVFAQRLTTRCVIISFCFQTKPLATVIGPASCFTDFRSTSHWNNKKFN